MRIANRSCFLAAIGFCGLGCLAALPLNVRAPRRATWRRPTAKSAESAKPRDFELASITRPAALPLNMHAQRSRNPKACDSSGGVVCGAMDATTKTLLPSPPSL